MDKTEFAAASQSESSRPRKWLRRARLVPLLAVAAVLMATASVAAGGLVQTSASAADIQTALGHIFADGRCVTLSEAQTSVRATLDSLGHNDWTISEGGGVRATGCVGAGISTSARRIILIPSARPDVSQALQVAAKELMSQCLGKEAATSLIASLLADLGETDWEIRSDGPLTAPISEKDAVLKRVASGCYVYSGMGWRPNGQSIFFISGQ